MPDKKFHQKLFKDNIQIIYKYSLFRLKDNNLALKATLATFQAIFYDPKTPTVPAAEIDTWCNYYARKVVNEIIMGGVEIVRNNDIYVLDSGEQIDFGQIDDITKEIMILHIWFKFTEKSIPGLIGYDEKVIKELGNLGLQKVTQSFNARNHTTYTPPQIMFFIQKLADQTYFNLDQSNLEYLRIQLFQEFDTNKVVDNRKNSPTEKDEETSASKVIGIVLIVNIIFLGIVGVIWLVVQATGRQASPGTLFISDTSTPDLTATASLEATNAPFITPTEKIIENPAGSFNSTNNNFSFSYPLALGGGMSQVTTKDCSDNNRAEFIQFRNKANMIIMINPCNFGIGDFTLVSSIEQNAQSGQKFVIATYVNPVDTTEIVIIGQSQSEQGGVRLAIFQIETKPLEQDSDLKLIQDMIRSLVFN